MGGGDGVSDELEPGELEGSGMHLSMKPLLAVAIQEAVKLALIDSVYVRDGDEERPPNDDERREWRWDVYAIPDESLARIDPVALAQNVCVRLLGTGGWYANGVYSGNATPREVLEACLERPDEDPIAGAAFSMGLVPAGDGMFRFPTDRCLICQRELEHSDHKTSEYGPGYAHDECIEEHGSLED
jgi:hypothetical protein